MQLKQIFLITILSVSAMGIKAQDELITFILVRHVEKVDNSADSDISQEGFDRAMRLAELLKETKLTHIYSSDFRRTRQTVKKIGEDHQLTTEIYNSKRVDDLAVNLKRLPEGSTVLVSGHSNTTPQLANLLLKKMTYKAFEETDYGNIILVTIGKKQAAHSLLLRY